MKKMSRSYALLFLCLGIVVLLFGISLGFYYLSVPAKTDAIGGNLTVPRVDNIVEPIPVEQNTIEKKSSWCIEAKNGLWISSEFFNGMTHAPTIQHICRGENEVFYLLMDWDDTAIQHTGKLIAVHSSSTFFVVSVHKDPEIILLDAQNNQYPNQVWISIDGMTVIFDETNSFSSSLK
ncbi:hypothetical protein GW765_00815 [Candidatus Parcubacteria bacterium]|uniref:Uncharacterized protein n=1 Tax=Candidatus Magasanikbacteria bacterium CG10_big_fil_rev_8_21_14_0_10_38_6 TaxID=1974647 RepID=A0A2M6NZH8_9BACT|nr:hypothetical protein [Candidatus Parcubacteria bacterium]PIR76883.1 MAG: hypothetical protein COU30_05475 [Candidatus Magasanikbacteria bacterium CG10_big_fil_rev_8_21_14_0_10_38_6]